MTTTAQDFQALYADLSALRAALVARLEELISDYGPNNYHALALIQALRPGETR